MISYSVSGFGLIDGGFAGLIWMFVIVFVGFIFVYASMAEMASMYGIPDATEDHFLIIKGLQQVEASITGSQNLRPKDSKNS